MKKISLVFVHNGKSSYLKEVVTQAYNFNKDADIYLLGDEENIDLPFVKHYMIDQYSESSKQFEKVYEHMSSNHYEFELRCFRRWLIINEFIKEKSLEYILCLDSDVLLFCNVDKIFNHFLKYDYTISRQYSPHVTLFSRESLDKFCRYLIELYTQKDFLEKLRMRYNGFITNNKPGGICDMTAFFLYKCDISDNIKELSEISTEFFFDGNMNDGDGFEMKDGIKKIYWKNELPYAKNTDSGRYIRFYALHFQGEAKNRIHKYTLNDKLKRRCFISSVISSWWKNEYLSFFGLKKFLKY